MPDRPPQHNPYPNAQRRAPDYRESAAKRGYDARWRKIRELYAASHPAICVVCGYAGASAEMELDHKVPLARGGTHGFANLQWMCGAKSVVRGGNDCHGRKTVAEDGGLGHMPTK